MTDILKIDFIDNPAIKDRMPLYDTVDVDVQKVLESWRASLYSFEWVLPDGRIKNANELPEREKIKREVIEKSLQQGQALEKPVLGIGLLENVEIGIGRHIFLTTAALGIKEIPVHIPKSHCTEFEPFLS